jgi:hypothetical protein
VLRTELILSSVQYCELSRTVEGYSAYPTILILLVLHCRGARVSIVG